MTERPSNELKSMGYEIFIGLLSILSILNLLLVYLVQDASLDTVLERHERRPQRACS